MKIEKEILENAVQSLNRETGIAVTYKQHAPNKKELGDAVLKLNLDKTSVLFEAEVKRNLNDVIIGQIVMQSHKVNSNFLLVANYVHSTAAMKLKKLEICYLDTAGNAYLRAPGLHIHIQGKKLTGKVMSPVDLFNQTGIKSILAFINTSGLENQPYREIAEKIKVPRASLGRFMKDMDKAGFIETNIRKERVLVRKPELIRRWVEAFAEKFRPRLTPVRYFSVKYKDRWWENVSLEKYNAVWGGETAAARLGNYLKPQNVTIYADSKLKRLQAEYGLVKDENGNVEILDSFWTSGEIKNCAPPMVVYSDLLLTADKRNIEAAKMIYDQYIAPFI